MGYLTFAQIADEVGNMVQDKSANRLTIIKQAINRAYLDVARSQDWPQLWNSIEDLQPILHYDVRYFPLPRDADVPGFVGDNNNYQILEGQNPSIFWRNVMGVKDTLGNPVAFTHVGAYTQHNMRSVAAVIAGEQIHLKSTEPADVGQAVTIRFFGVPSQTLGIPIDKVVRMVVNGTNEVDSSLGGVDLPQEGLCIRSIGIDGDAAGEVYIYENSQPGFYGGITPGRRVAPMIHWFRLWPNNTVLNSLTIAYKRRPEFLLSDEDVPVIPVSGYLVEYVTGKILGQMGKEDRATFHFAEAKAMLQTLSQQFSGENGTVKVAFPKFGTFSTQRLGAWEPRGVNP
jgi:hypothetical protein